MRTTEQPSTGRDRRNRVPAWLALHPVHIATQGAPSEPVETMIGAQSRIYRLIVALENLRVPRVIPALRGLVEARLANLARR